MRRSSFVTIALALLIAAWAQLAAAQNVVGSGVIGDAKPHGGGGVTPGPVDAVANPLGCWSLRACTAALRGQKALNVCVSGTCADILTDATTGDPVPQTINGTSCPSAGSNCLIKTLYFQVGSMTCAISCDLTNGSLGSSNPIFSTSCGSLTKSFCMLFDAANSVRLDTSTTTQSQPLTFIAVAMQTGALGANNGIFNAAPIELSFESAASNLAFIYAGSALISQTQSSNAWHSIIGISNTSGSPQAGISIDGAAQTTGNAGSATISAAAITLGASAFTEYMTGDVVEVLLYPTAFSNGDDTKMCHNQFSYWGTSTSC
jgi:hypothetical protein